MNISLTASARRHALLLSFALVLIGCNGLSTTAQAAPPEATQPSIAGKVTLKDAPAAARTAAANLRETLDAAWEKSKDAPFKQRDAVRERMKTAEAALDARILEWTAKKDAVADDARPAVAAAHKEVLEAREVLDQKIEALGNATEETWNSLKAELDTAWQRMSTAAGDLAALLQKS